MRFKKILSLLVAVTMLFSCIGITAMAEGSNVAKVGNTEYASIDEAIAAWTNGTTLTLLADVILSDVITLKSTEHHILDLGTYTMTAASKKDAIQIENNGRSNASYALDIKADATNPGGITATGKAVVRTAGKSGVKDRPIIRFYGGVFNASYIVYHTGSNGTNCPQFQFHGGEFNGTIYTNRTLNQFYGGTFNGSLMMSVDSSAYTLVAGGTFKQLSNLYMSSLNSDKFTIGSAKGKYDKEVYIDDAGNYVIAAAEPEEGIEAAVAKTPGTNDYLAYSKVATEGELNYTDVYVALNKNNSASAEITVYVDELDMTGINYKGTIVVPEGEEITIIVEEGTEPTWTISEGANVTYTDDEGNALEKDEDGSFVKPDTGETNADVIVKGVGVEIAPVDGVSNSYEITLAAGETWTDGASVTMTFPAVEGATDGDFAYVVHEHEGVSYIYVGKVAGGSVTITNTVGFSTFTVYDGDLADALAAASAMTGDVTVEIYDKVTLNQSLSGSYDSITFVGKTDVAEIYLEVQGYITANGKDVAFEDLILSKSEGGYITNAGFMNVAFGIYDVKSVTYTNCTFANGAYASSGKNTFTNCTFKRSHDKYGLWAYGNVEAIVDDCTFADYRGIKMYAEGAAKTVDLTVKNTDFSAVTDKPAIVLTYGESVTLEKNTYSSTGVFELDLDGAPNGTTVTSDVAPTCKNDNGACGVLVDGKIYTTVAQAAEVATEGSKVTLLHNSTETVEFVEGVELDKNNFEAAGVTVKVAAVAEVNGVPYATLVEAVANAKVGDTITLIDDATLAGEVTLPAEITFNGNGKTITLEAGAVLTFNDGTVINGASVKDGGSTATASVKYYGTINFHGTNEMIPTDTSGVGGPFHLVVNEDATLLINRFVLGYDRKITVKGTIEDAHSFDPTGKTPSLKFNSTSGVSVGGTGTGDLIVENAYVELDSSTWKNSYATHTWSFKNSYVSATSFGSNNPPGSDSAAWNVTFDDSVVAAKNYIKAAKNVTYSLTNGSVANTNSLLVAGTLNIDETSSLTAKAQQNNSVGVQDGHGDIAGTINVKGTLNIDGAAIQTFELLGGTVNVDGGVMTTGKMGLNLTEGSVLKVSADGSFTTNKVIGTGAIEIDAADMTVGNVSTITADVTDFAGTINVINNDELEVEVVDGKITLIEKPKTFVAYIGEQGYETVQAAINAAKKDETVTICAGEYDPINISNKNITIQGTVGDDGELLTTIKGGNPAITGHSFNGTIKDIKIVDAWKVMYAEPAGNVTVDNVYVTGATYGFHLVAYSPNLTWTIQNSYMDLAWANSFGVYGDGYADIIIKGNEFVTTDPYYPDYGAIHVNSFLPSVTVEENIFRENARIYIDGSVTDTSKIKVSKNYHADGVENAFADDAEGVQIEIDSYYKTVDENGNLTDLVIIPKGSINGGLVNLQDANRTFLTIESYLVYANESVVVKVYDASDTLLATSSLVDNDRVILGKENWGGLSTFVGINCTDEWWDVEWEEGKLSADYVPAKATLFVDGVEMNTAPIQMRAAGSETEVVWAEVPGVPKASVAKIGDTEYTDIQEALKALKSGDTLTLLDDITIDYYWDARNTGGKITVPVTIDGNEKTIKFTDTVYDAGNQYSAFRFESDATVKNLTIDMSEAISGFGGRFRAISAKGDLTVDNCKFIGNGSENNTRAIIFGEGAGTAIGDVEVTITNSTFTGWRRGVSDNENVQDAKSVVVTGNTFTDAGVALSATDVITFTGNTVDGKYVSIKSYTDSENLIVTATGNTLTENVDENNQNYIDVASKNVNAQDEFCIIVENVAEVNGVGYETLQAAINAAAEGDTVTLLSDVALEKSISFTKDITFTIDGAGFAIKPAQGSTETNSAFNFGQGSNATVENKNYTIKNIVFDGWTTDHVLRLQGVNATVENCKFINCNQPDGLGLLTLTYCEATVEDCVFENNTCVKAIDVNSNANADATNDTEIKNCTFENNNCSGPAGVIEAYEGAFTIKDSKFVGNTAVSASIFCATDADISGNYFAENTYTGTKGNEASVLAGPWVAGTYAIEINDNAFTDASVPGAFVEDWSETYDVTAAYNLNGNYWTGGEPNYGKSGSPVVTLENYYTTYENGVLGGLVTLAPAVATVNGTEYTSLQAALDAAAASTGNVTVEILDDIDLTNVDWNPVTVSAPGYPVVTVNGNEKTITGLNDMLFAGTWAGGSGLIINDLTIKDSNIVNDENDSKGNIGVGAFIGYPQASATITLNNCHLIDSKVSGGHWTGGLIGIAGGYSGNDGPVFMNLTIMNCSVTGSTITGKGSAGGISGHAANDAWTNVVIENTTVSGNTVTSTGSSTNKAGAVMGTIGAAGQSATAAGEAKTGGVSVSATVSDNTVSSGGTTITTIYGRQGSSTGALTITGGTYENYPIEENVSYAAPAEGYEIVENENGTWGVVEVELFDFYTTTVTLDNSLAINFYVEDKNLTGDGYYAEVEHKLADGTTNKVTIPYEEWGTKTAGYHSITYKGLVAKHMSDEIRVTIYDSNSQVSETRVDGLRAYALRGLEKFTDTKLLTALVDMLNYGAAAQLQFNYNTDNLANEGLTDAQKAYASTSESVENIQIKGDNYLTTTLSLENNIQLTGYFTFADGVDGKYAQVEFTDSYNNTHAYTVTSDKFVKNTNKIYGVCVEDLAIADAKCPVTITLYNADGSAYGSLVDSMSSYLYRIMQTSDAEIFKMIARFTTSAYNALH